MSPRAGRLARRVPLLLALALAGCPAGSFLHPCPDCAASQAAEGAAKEDTASKDGEPKKADKPPPPHTLPQALCAYWRALCSHPCSCDAEEKKNGEESKSGEEKKNGDEKKNGEQKKNGESANGSEDKG